MIAAFTTVTRGAVVIMFFASISSCGFESSNVNSNYARAVRSGFAVFPEALQMENLFGVGDHFISSLGPNGTRKWNSEVFFGGRYTLTMQADIKTDDEFSKIAEVVGSPLFVLTEASRVLASPDRVLGAEFSQDWKFGLSDWKKVFEAKGDFSMIGITINKTKPLHDFDSYVKAIREPRIEVRPE